MTATKPTWGVVGAPLKEHGKRVDFKFELLETLLEAKGYRLAWWRAAVCPCAPVNVQADSPDPNCSLCHGVGWYYFGADQPVPSAVGDMDQVQRLIVGPDDGDHAAVIRGLQTSIQETPNIQDRQGRWVSGETMVTTRAENKLGFWDRLVNLDATMGYSQLLTSGAGDLLPGRYPMTGVNMLRSQDRVYEPEVDYVLDQGQVRWFPGRAPATGTRLSIHYLCHPTWIVVEHPHVLRASTLKLKIPEPQTPEGNFRSLPLQARVRLEFLVSQ